MLLQGGYEGNIERENLSEGKGGCVGKRSRGVARRSIQGGLADLLSYGTKRDCHLLNCQYLYVCVGDERQVSRHDMEVRVSERERDTRR